MYKNCIKRILDFCIALLALSVLWPILLVITMFLHFANKGAGAFFTQERPGKDAKIFKVIKYKTMTDERDADGKLLPDAQRLTRIGKIVRSLSIDELPQLFNVLKGDMSFVGPRPEVRPYVDMYNDDQKQVLKVRPGITDPASIKYRNENDILSSVDNPEEYYIKEIMPDKLKINIEYINNRSFIKDIKIILQTIKG
jgi:lipopolysaccharide/colanic/teichoic acid biosynthesis glycosyltransferase